MRGGRKQHSNLDIHPSDSLMHPHRMLRGLLSASGANASMVTVYIDGFFQEPVEVASLFDIRAIQVGLAPFHTCCCGSFTDVIP